jgi:hypothetical protein
MCRSRATRHLVLREKPDRKLEQLTSSETWTFEDSDEERTRELMYVPFEVFKLRILAVYSDALFTVNGPRRVWLTMLLYPKGVLRPRS